SAKTVQNVDDLRRSGAGQALPDSLRIAREGRNLRCVGAVRLRPVSVPLRRCIRLEPLVSSLWGIGCGWSVQIALAAGWRGIHWDTCGIPTIPGGLGTKSLKMNGVSMIGQSVSKEKRQRIHTITSSINAGAKKRGCLDRLTSRDVAHLLEAAGWHCIYCLSPDVPGRRSGG